MVTNRVEVLYCFSCFLGYILFVLILQFRPCSPFPPSLPLCPILWSNCRYVPYSSFMGYDKRRSIRLDFYYWFKSFSSLFCFSKGCMKGLSIPHIKPQSWTKYFNHFYIHIYSSCNSWSCKLLYLFLRFFVSKRNYQYQRTPQTSLCSLRVWKEREREMGKRGGWKCRERMANKFEPHHQKRN